MSNQDSTQNVPVLRLDGFEGEWAERPLGSFAKRVQRKNTDLESTLPLTISAQYGLVDQITYSNNRVASDNLVNYLLVKNGEFAYNKSFSSGHPVGTVKRLDKYDSGALSTLYIVFRIVEDGSIDSDYLVTFFETSRWHRFVEARSAEGARNHGLLNISAKDFLDVPVSLAPTKHKQQAIGAVFTNLDAAIDQHTNKRRVLQHTKTALIQRMFPQDGHTLPDLRLDGFEGEWVSCVFKDVAVLSRGLTYGPNDIVQANKGTRVLRSANIQDDAVITSEDDVWVRNDAVGIPLIEAGDILITGSNGSPRLVGKHAIVGHLVGDSVHGGFMLKATTHQPDFVNALMGASWYDSFISLHTRGGSGSIGNLDTHELSRQLIYIPPTVEEQQAIGAVFTKLDTLISAEAQFIEKLKQTKTALLQKMFV